MSGGAGSGPVLELVPPPGADALAAVRLAASVAGVSLEPAQPYAGAWRRAGLREGVTGRQRLGAPAQHLRRDPRVVET